MSNGYPYHHDPKSQPTWYWKSNIDPWVPNERERWTMYTPENQNKIENWFKAGGNKLHIQVPGHGQYEIDFFKGLQTFTNDRYR